MAAGQKRVAGGMVAGYLGSLGVRRRLVDLSTKLRPGRPRLEFYWRAEDAYSHIMAQLVARLVDAYPLDLEITVVPAAAAEVDPEPQLRAAHAVRDARALASFYELSFSPRSDTPRPDRVRRANAVALLPRPPREHLDVLLRVGEAIFGEGGAALSELARTLGAVEGTLVTTTLEANYLTLRERGHYQSATLRYGGEWYEGPHRILNLEERLEAVELELLRRPSDALLAELMEYGSKLKKLRRIGGYHEACFRNLIDNRGEQVGLNRSRLNDLHENSERLQSLASLLDEISKDLKDGYLSLSAHRLNHIMRVLTVVTVIFVPMTFVAGLYGMNFEYMPELKWHYGYFAALGVMTVIALGLLWVFKRRGWM